MDRAKLYEIAESCVRMVRSKKSAVYRRNHIYVYGPSMAHISSKAKISVREKLEFNKQWSLPRILKNRTPGSLFVAEGAELTVENNFVFHSGCRVTVNQGAKLALGSGYFNHDSIIECFNEITIGEDTCVSERVLFRDSNNHKILRDGYQVTAPIHVGNHVWIGVGVTVLSGVTIGDGAVIAAGSVVTSDIPAGCLAAGVPARVVREGIEWEY